MRRIIHRELGPPSEVLQLVDGPAPADPSAGSVLVSLRFAPIHPGDLLGIEGSPAFGTPDIPAEGRIPGFEGSGVVTAVADDIADWKVGDRVAFFPAANVWSEVVEVPAASLVRIPDGLSDEIAAHALINVATTKVLLTHGHEAVPEDRRQDVVVIQTGANSAVGRLMTMLLVKVGVEPIRFVRSVESVASLDRLHPGVRTIASESATWRNELRDAVAGREIHVALDGVGGDVIGRISEFLVPGATVISYGSLGGHHTDIRSIVPRRLVIKGVTVMEWAAQQPIEQARDRETAMDLALHAPQLFGVAAAYQLERFRDAVAHVDRPGKNGTVLLQF